MNAVGYDPQYVQLQGMLANERAGMAPGGAILIAVIVIVLVAIIIALIFQAPAVTSLLQKGKKKVNALHTPQHRQHRSAMRQPMANRGRFSGVHDSHDAKKSLNLVPGMHSHNEAIPTPLRPSVNAPKQYQRVDSKKHLSSVPNMRSGPVHRLTPPKAPLTKHQIARGINHQAVATSHPQVDTRLPRGNGWQDLWLHGDINKQTNLRQRPIIRQSHWAEYQY